MNPPSPVRLPLSLVVALLGASLLLESCAVGIATRRVFGESYDLQVRVDPLANSNTPLAMDVVYVYDDDLFKSLMQTSAEQWFLKKKEILANYPDDIGLEVWSNEWTPDTTSNTTLHVPLRSGTVGGFIFVNYFNPGPHRVRVQLFRDLKVVLREDDFVVEPD